MTRKLDIEIHDDFGPGKWAQEKYLVHGYEDVMFTSDLDEALQFLKSQIQLLENENTRSL